MTAIERGLMRILDFHHGPPLKNDLFLIKVVNTST